MDSTEWNEGYDASRDNRPKTSNTYKPGSEKYREWNLGYEAHQRTLQRRS